MPAAATKPRARHNPKVRRGQYMAEAVGRLGEGHREMALATERYADLRAEAILGVTEAFLSAAREIAQRFQAAFQIDILSSEAQADLVTWVGTFWPETVQVLVAGKAKAQAHAAAMLEALSSRVPEIARALQRPGVRDAVAKIWRASLIWITGQIDRVVAAFLATARLELPELDRLLEHSPAEAAQLRTDLQSAFANVFPASFDLVLETSAPAGPAEAEEGA